MNLDILIGMLWLTLDDKLNTIVPTYRSSLEGALYELMSLEKNPKAKNEYKDIALQYQLDIILSTKNLPKEVVNTVIEIGEKLQPKDVWQVELEKIQYGKCND